MFPVLITVAGFPIHTYGVLMAAGFFLAVFVIRRMSERLHLDPELMVDWAFGAMMVGVIGSRILFVLTTWSYFVERPLEIFQIWQGGLVFYGGPLAVVPYTIWFARRRGLSFWEISDVAVLGLVIGHAVGRWGCIATGCCYGKPTSLPWGMILPPELVEVEYRGLPLHPAPLYESFGLMVLFIFLRRIALRRAYPGQVTVAYFGLYAALRFAVEVIRGDKVRGFIIEPWLSTSQGIALLMLVVAVLLHLWKSRRFGIFKGFFVLAAVAMGPSSQANEKRVVALTPSLGEWVQALGHGGELMGSPDFTELSSGTTTVNLGPFHQISAESVYKLKPDIVLASDDGTVPHLVARLKRLKLHVVTIRQRSLSDIASAPLEMVHLLGSTSEGQKLAEQFRVALSSLSPLPSWRGKRVMIVFGEHPLYVGTSLCFFGEILGKLGAQVLPKGDDVGGKGYIHLLAEKIAVIDPDLILTVPMMGPKGRDDKTFTLEKATGGIWSQLSSLRAVQAGQVLRLPRDVFTKPSPRLLRGVEVLRSYGVSG